MRPKNKPGIPVWRGDALRMRRLADRWSSEALAARVGVSRSTLQRWERDENAPTSSHLNELAEALGVPQHTFAREPRVV